MPENKVPENKKIPFDEQVNKNFEFEDLDIAELKKTFWGLQHIKITNENLLSLKLVKESNGKLYPTNGLLILLGKLDNVKFKCARFKGNTTKTFIDKNKFGGDIFEQLKNVELFIRSHFNLNKKEESWLKIKNPGIPWNLLREAILNAVIHRDYSKKRDIKLAIFDDIIEITSPGAMPNSIKLEDALKEGRSETRNKVVVKVFQKLGLIEEWGKGLNKIINVMNDKGLKFEFRDSSDFVQAIFYKKSTEEIKNTSKKVLYDENDTVSTFGVTVNKCDVTVGLTSVPLNRLNTIINSIKENKYTNLKDIAKKLNVSLRTIKRDIKKMKKNKIIIRKGSDKTGYWEIVE